LQFTLHHATLSAYFFLIFDHTKHEQKRNLNPAETTLQSMVRWAARGKEFGDTHINCWNDK